MAVPAPATALLLIAHGSRNSEANADLFHLAAQLREQAGYPIVEAAFLELAEPTIEQAGDKCAAQGAGCVLLLPYFLSAGIHVRDDLTKIRDDLARRFPHIEFRLGEPLGRHPLLVEIVRQRAQELEEEPEA